MNFCPETAYLLFSPQTYNIKILRNIYLEIKNINSRIPYNQSFQSILIMPFYPLLLNLYFPINILEKKTTFILDI